MLRFWKRNNFINKIYIVLRAVINMAGSKTRPKKEPEIIEGFRSIPITDLRVVMQRESNNKYTAEYPIFDEQHKLLLDRGKTISDDRFRQLELLNWKNMKMHKTPKYYFQRKSTEIEF